MPKVSIIVPVYNTEKYLHTCLDSIMAQTFFDFEAILVDDGSTDNSGKICDEYAEKDKRIIVLHKDNEGVAKARIDAFEHSIGEYITFVDADDYVESDYIKKLVEPINKYKVDLVCCKHNLQYDNLVIPSSYTANGYFDKTNITSFISSEYLYNDKLGHSSIPIFLVTKLIKRSFVSKGLLAGKGLWWGEDQIAAFYILMNVHSMFVLNECLYYYVRHEGQTTSVYNTSLWTNQLNAYTRYKAIDKNNQLKIQLIKHVWKFSFLVNLYNKMPLKIHSYSDFSKELKKIDKLDGWKDFFNGRTTGLGWRNNLKFWMLKFKLYWAFYYMFLKKHYEK